MNGLEVFGMITRDRTPEQQVALLADALTVERNVWARRFIWAVVGIAVALFVGITSASAHDTEHYYALPHEEKLWLEGLLQPNGTGVRCCGEADAYFADSWRVKGDRYVITITDTRVVPNRPYIEPGTEIEVPNEKHVLDRGNPTGHGIVFLDANMQVLCFIQPGGG